jgi:hypothetical protein
VKGKLSGLPFLIAKKQVAEVKEKESRSKVGVWQEKRKSCQE